MMMDKVLLFGKRSQEDLKSAMEFHQMAHYGMSSAFSLLAGWWALRALGELRDVTAPPRPDLETLAGGLEAPAPVLDACRALHSTRGDSRSRSGPRRAKENLEQATRVLTWALKGAGVEVKEAPDAHTPPRSSRPTRAEPSPRAEDVLRRAPAPETRSA